MFDLRYHVASLAAVFLALVIGIVVGVGLSSGGFVSKGERSLLNSEIDELQRSLDAARLRTGDLSRTQRGATTYVEESYPLLMAERLASRRVALVFVGPVDAELRGLVERALIDAGAGATLRLRAIRVPVDLEALGNVLRRPAGTGPVRASGGGARARTKKVCTGARPGREGSRVAAAGPTAGGGARRERGVTGRRGRRCPFGATSAGPDVEVPCRGFYEGLASSGVPAVGVETSHVTPTTRLTPLTRRACRASTSSTLTSAGLCSRCCWLEVGPAATA